MRKGLLDRRCGSIWDPAIPTHPSSRDVGPASRLTPTPVSPGCTSSSSLCKGRSLWEPTPSRGTRTMPRRPPSVSPPTAADAAGATGRRVCVTDRSCALASSPLVRRVVPTLRSSSWTPPRSSAGAAWNIHVAASAPTGVLVRTLLRSDVQSLAACSPWRCRPRQPRCPTEPTPLRPSWIYGGCRASPCRWARSACWACLADLPSRCPCTGVVHVITRKRQRCPAPWSRSLCPPAAGAVCACRPVRWFCRGARHTRRCSGEPRPWLGPCRA